MTPPDDYDDIDAFVLPAAHGPEAGRPAPKQFQPWHKPRKQWVRNHVLVQNIRELADKLVFPADSPFFRYLSLPGDDLLDIRLLAPVLHRRGLILNYVGFNSVGKNSDRELRLSLAENEVRNLAGVYRDSKIYRDRIEHVGFRDSLQWTRVRDCSPYHAINIDLCDHIAAKSQDNLPTYISAVAEIVHLQLKRSRDPWLLFIATCVAPGSVDAANLAAFISAIRANIEASADFGNGLRDVLCREGGELEAALASPHCLAPERFRDLFSIGFGKWLLHYMGSATPRTKLTLLRSCHYPVGGEEADLVTLAFRCDPLIEPPVDNYLLVNAGGHPSPEPDEVACALALIERSAAMINIHEMLTRRPDLYRHLTQESHALLKESHYPVDRYEEWLREYDPLSGLLADPVGEVG